MDVKEWIMTLYEHAEDKPLSESNMGFDLDILRPVIEKLPNGLSAELESLFRMTWPNHDWGNWTVQFHSPECIKDEHEDLVPCCYITAHGFLALGTEGSGEQFCYSMDDQKIYMISHELVDNDSIIDGMEEIPLNTQNLKKTAVQTWDSLVDFFQWYYDESTAEDEDE